MNLLGNFPASFAYSFLLDIFIKKHDDDISEGHQDAMKYIMFYNFVGLLAIIISMIFRLNQEDEETKDKMLTES